eukprot:TRINITY_DN6882_c0_g3_i1.p1 TRINITY_DN6882_c0_g3~~TRINITY_DN6882_c0_g3_i1.p1  ORF type:complete len:260 (-),score=28.86 TRINITY_DN6882_c0_g3_i1:207-986(-)
MFSLKFYVFPSIILSILAIFLVVASSLDSGFLDYHQCDRRCRNAYGTPPDFNRFLDMNVTGVREVLSLDTCECSINKAVVGSISRDTPFDPPTMPAEAVCGANGKNYESQEEACAAGTYPLHGGYCGACSNHHDINIYNYTRNNLTDVTTKCATLYAILGEEAVRNCMLKEVGFTAPCTQCWVDNIGCDTVTCFAVCVDSKVRRENNTNPDGTLNKCLACDEDYCGNPFISCAGANRRRSGIRSDIDRPQDQIWKRYAC